MHSLVKWKTEKPFCNIKDLPNSMSCLQQSPVGNHQEGIQETAHLESDPSNTVSLLPLTEQSKCFQSYKVNLSHSA